MTHTTHPPYGDFVSVSFVRRRACRDVDDRDPGPGSRHYKFGGQKSPPTFSKFHTVEHKRIVDCFRLKYIGVPPLGWGTPGDPPRGGPDSDRGSPPPPPGGGRGCPPPDPPGRGPPQGPGGPGPSPPRGSLAPRSASAYAAALLIE